MGIDFEMNKTHIFTNHIIKFIVLRLFMSKNVNKFDKNFFFFFKKWQLMD